MARQPSAKPSPKAAKAAAVTQPETPKEKREPLSLQKAATFSSDIRTLAVNVTILLIILLIVPVVLSQFLRNEVLVDPIAVPEAMQATGLTPEIAARRLWDGLGEVREIAGTAKATINAIPDSEQVDFSIPDSGLSIDSLIYYVRRFFNIYETHIGGEFRCGDPECSPAGITLRLRIVRNDVTVRQLGPVGTATEADYFLAAATEVMSVLDPFTAMAARADTQPGRAKALAFQLVARGGADAKWAHNLIGNLLLREDKAAEAIAQYRAALTLDPNFHLARTNLGNALRVNNDRVGASEAYSTVYKADPKNVAAIQGLAALAQLDGKLDEAIRLLLAAAQVDPGEPSYFVRVANIERDRGDAEKAQAYWKKALEVDPANQAALANMALFFYNDSRFAEAETLYGAAADYDPDNAEAQGNHADVLLLTQNFKRAAERADQAIKLAPRVAQYHIIRGRALVNLNRPEEALAEFDIASGLEPRNPDIPYRASEAYEKLGRLEDAIAAYRAFIELSPDSQLRAIAEAYITIFEARIAAEAASEATVGPVAPSAAPSAAPQPAG